MSISRRPKKPRLPLREAWRERFGKQDVDLLPDEELQRRAREINNHIQYPALAVAIPLMIIPLPLINTAFSWMVHTSPIAGLGAIVIALWAKDRSTAYEEIIKKRELASEDQRFRDAQRSLIEDFKRRYGVELTAKDLVDLGFPRKTPGRRDTVSFGTIQRFVPSKIGGGSVEWLTLIWNRGRFELLTGGSKTLS